MNAKQLFQDGKVREAQSALSAWLRSHPDDVTQRTFLFELLCFSGDWTRAERQLAILREGSEQRDLGGLLYASALYAERMRHDLFAQQPWPEIEATVRLTGKLNGRRFHSIGDADPAIGARVEIFAAGSYQWLSFEHIQSIRMAAPRKLRDTLWISAAIQTTPQFHGGELGEILIPAVYPFSWQSPQETVWLGRETRWIEDGGRERPVGQKMLLVDGEETPLLELRDLEFEEIRVAGHA